MSKGVLNPELVQKLRAHDKRHGFPEGTMEAVVLQESSGRAEFLDKPDTYHYAPDAQGRRIAKHTGKVSTAFGPFGILESTAKDPGYGVTPLKDKSLDEQMRFAADYLAARAKAAGGLEKGLAGYGEGARYAQSVQGKRDGVAAVQVAQAAPQAPNVETASLAPVADRVPDVVPVAAVLAQTKPEYVPGGEDAWAELQKRLTRPVKAQDLAYEPLIPESKAAHLFADLKGLQPKNRVNFGLLSALKGFA